MITRRDFLQRSSLALGGVAAMSCVPSHAAGTGPLGRPIGVQLYTVRQDATRDLNGTLERIAEIGYREVETAGFYGKTGKELRGIFASHNLTAPSAHGAMQDLHKNMQKRVDEVAELGAQYLVCAFPAVPDTSPIPSGGNRTIANSITLDHWKWNAEQLNRLGELAKKAGLRAGYHNHNMEFRSYEGVVAFDKLLEWTDPALVTFELDVAWVVTGGADPIAYLKKYPQRISMLHVKEVRKDAVTTAEELRSQTTEIGRGKVDWKRLFAACDPKNLKHYFVEQENFDGPAPLDAIRVSYEYLQTLKV